MAIQGHIHIYMCIYIKIILETFNNKTILTKSIYVKDFFVLERLTEMHYTDAY